MNAASEPTKSQPSPPAQEPKKSEETDRDHLDKLLDEALDESFPASDPEAITVDRSSDESSNDSTRKGP
jgi:hypothetical protein